MISPESKNTIWILSVTLGVVWFVSSCVSFAFVGKQFPSKGLFSAAVVLGIILKVALLAVLVLVFLNLKEQGIWMLITGFGALFILILYIGFVSAWTHFKAQNIELEFGTEVKLHESMTAYWNILIIQNNNLAKLKKNLSETLQSVRDDVELNEIQAELEKTKVLLKNVERFTSLSGDDLKELPVNEVNYFKAVEPLIGRNAKISIYNSGAVAFELLFELIFLMFLLAVFVDNENKSKLVFAIIFVLAVLCLVNFGVIGSGVDPKATASMIFFYYALVIAVLFFTMAGITDDY